MRHVRSALVRSVVALATPLVVATAVVSPAARASGGFADSGSTVVTGLNRPEAMTGLIAGERWVADTFNNRVLRVAATGATTVISSGLGPYPGGVARDAAGRVFVADTFNSRIVRFDPGSTVGTVVAGATGTGTTNAGSGLDRLANPSKIAIDPAGNLLVVDTGNDRVLRYPGTTTAGVAGTVVAGGNGRGSGLSQLSLPVGLALDTAGNLYVADTLNSRVVRWAPGATAGTVVAGSTAGGGSGLDRLNRPAGVAVSPDGSVHVADTQNHRVVRWAPGAAAGVLVAGGTRGSAADQLNLPADVTVDPDGAITVADRENGRLIRFAMPVTVLPATDLLPLLQSLSAGTDVAPVQLTGTTFTVPGCAPAPLPASDADRIAALVGDPYTGVGGPAAALAPGCRPMAVTVRSPA